MLNYIRNYVTYYSHKKKTMTMILLKMILFCLYVENINRMLKKSLSETQTRPQGFVTPERLMQKFIKMAKCPSYKRLADFCFKRESRWTLSSQR